MFINEEANSWVCRSRIKTTEEGKDIGFVDVCGAER
jgi:hypothetical protein